MSSTTGESKDLQQRLKQGETQALGELFSRYRDRLWRTVSFRLDRQQLNMIRPLHRNTIKFAINQMRLIRISGQKVSRRGVPRTAKGGHAQPVLEALLFSGIDQRLLELCGRASLGRLDEKTTDRRVSAAAVAG